MTFDPFGDFATRGYLRNVARQKDLTIVRQMEHSSFTTGLEEAFAQLNACTTIRYEDVLSTHEVLFEAVYPSWAGQDRLATTPKLVITKGTGDDKIIFAYPQDINRAVAFALTRGQDKAYMAAHPGDVMGYLAHGHPFLDGNGRTIMTVHCVLAHRAGISIDWASTTKSDYLAALSLELEDPGKGHLDAYLKPFIRKGIDPDTFVANVGGAPGLDGENEDTVLGNTEDPRLKAEYEAQELKRKEAKP
ncbi:MAG: Fic family protein [Xanthobacteraceae bacterium]|nr:Fic family protein [Xanthobacteraceae bacterium]